MLNKSFDELRTNGKLLIPFVVSWSNHERNQPVQRLQKIIGENVSSIEQYLDLINEAQSELKGDFSKCLS